MSKILLVEDDADVRELLIDELAVQGYDVIEAESGEEGLRKFLDQKPQLVLCDRAMPGMSGYDMLERIRSKHPEFNTVPFVFMTALTDPRDKEAVAHLQPTDYIEKPIDLGALTAKIKSWV